MTEQANEMIEKHISEDHEAILRGKSQPETTLAPPSNNSPLESTTHPSASASDPTPDSTLPPHLSHDPLTNLKRSDPFQFGQRYLTPTDDVFAYNAWDHVVPDAAYTTYTTSQLTLQRAHPVSAYDQTRFNTAPAKWWDRFYREKATSFFKDRKWLAQEFPVLDEVMREDAGEKVVLEVGAGAGNTAFPIVRANRNPGLRVVAADFSPVAVKTMREAEGYDEAVVKAVVWDVASSPEGEDQGLPPGVQEGSVDVVVMIFIFSALNPRQWDAAVKNVWRVLKPGGVVLFRDYGRGDLAQVRFKKGKWMEENFYVRGDGTRVYFFERAEVARIWGGEEAELQLEKAEKDGEQVINGTDLQSDGGNITKAVESQVDELRVDELAIDQGPDRKVIEQFEGADADVQEQTNVDESAQTPNFEIMNLNLDRRLIVNRSMKLKMYRCWLQGRFRKLG